MSTIPLPVSSSVPAVSAHSRVNTAKPTAKAASADSSTDTSQTSVTALGSTFLQLLTQELQNQDPTAPMDSTQMVGQMISLNQLDQLASINQLLTTQFGTSSSGTGTSSTATSSTGATDSPSRAQAYAAAVQAALSGLNAGSAMSSTTTPNTSSLL